MDVNDRAADQFLAAFEAFIKAGSPAYRNMTGTANIQVGQIFSRQKVYEARTCEVGDQSIELVSNQPEAPEAIKPEVNEPEAPMTIEQGANQPEATEAIKPAAEQPAPDQTTTGGASIEVRNSDDLWADTIRATDTGGDANGVASNFDEEAQLSFSRKIEGTVDVPSTDGYVNVEEGCVKIVYGKSTEDRIADINTESLQNNASEVCLTNVMDTVIKAHVHLQRNEETEELLPRLAEGS
ncbi:hypothetical protein MMC28_008980 [Mycoblastus sanguinarius]|nr:hypothetical protein [Mycoblastus sanguinarius]